MSQPALPPPSADHLKEMPITAHLIELRAHLVRIFIAAVSYTHLTLPTKRIV